MSSALGVIVAGIGIFVCWIVAAHDDKFMHYDCGGCVRMFHDSISGRSGDLMNYYQNRKDAFPYLISFGIVCGVGWLLTAALAFCRPKWYLGVGAANFVMFVCVFCTLVERMREDRLCHLYEEVTGAKSAWEHFGCKQSEDWQIKNQRNSYEIFWSSSIACFIFAVYQLACAAALVYEAEMTDLIEPKGHERVPESSPHSPQDVVVEKAKKPEAPAAVTPPPIVQEPPKAVIEPVKAVAPTPMEVLPEPVKPVIAEAPVLEHSSSPKREEVKPAPPPIVEREKELDIHPPMASPVPEMEVKEFGSPQI